MGILYRIIQYAGYRFRSGNRHDVHSPFVYDLLTNVITDTTPYYSYELIEALRSSYLINRKEINVRDHGTGGKNNPVRKTTVSEIARRSVKRAKYGQLLFRLSNRFRPENIIELGTSLGISTLYLAMPSAATRVVTIEGSEETARIARQGFEKLKCDNIHLLTGTFEDMLPKVLEITGKPGIVYFDGNHTKQATLNYYDICKGNSDENSIFIFDDIHWSREMTEAWDIIRADDSVRLSIDLFEFGLVFFKNISPTKQHFVLRF